MSLQHFKKGSWYVRSSINDVISHNSNILAQRAAAGQDIILLTAVTNPTNLDNLGETYRREKVNVHLLYFKGDKQSTAVSKLTEFGSVHHVPSSIDDRDMNLFTWTIDALQNIYSRTYNQRELVTTVSNDDMHVSS